MPHFKAFQATVSGVPEIERQINAWMETERPRILFYAQGMLGNNSLVFTFVYERAEDAAGALAATTAAEVPQGIEHSLEAIDLDPSDTEMTLLPEAELPY